MPDTNTPETPSDVPVAPVETSPLTDADVAAIVDLHDQFRADMAAARLSVTELNTKVFGKPYSGPAVLVRDFALVRNATKLHLVTAAAEASNSFYVLPTDGPVDL